MEAGSEIASFRGMIGSSQTLGRTIPALGALPGQAGLLDRLRETVAAFTCTLRGHAPDLQLSADRMWLECPRCARTTSGWALDGPRPRLRFHGDPGRFRAYAWVTAADTSSQPSR